MHSGDMATRWKLNKYPHPGAEHEWHIIAAWYCGIARRCNAAAMPAAREKRGRGADDGNARI
jgi:hypothetical protein